MRWLALAICVVALGDEAVVRRARAEPVAQAAAHDQRRRDQADGQRLRHAARTAFASAARRLLLRLLRLRCSCSCSCERGRSFAHIGSSSHLCTGIQRQYNTKPRKKGRYRNIRTKSRHLRHDRRKYAIIGCTITEKEDPDGASCGGLLRRRAGHADAHARAPASAPDGGESEDALPAARHVGRRGDVDAAHIHRPLRRGKGPRRGHAGRRPWLVYGYVPRPCRGSSLFPGSCPPSAGAFSPSSRTGGKTPLSAASPWAATGP